MIKVDDSPLFKTCSSLNYDFYSLVFGSLCPQGPF